MRYYLIRDDLDTNHVIAIHRILDSALACFSAYISSGDYEDHLEIVEIDTNERGIVVSDAVAFSYNKRMRTFSATRPELVAIIDRFRAGAGAGPGANT